MSKIKWFSSKQYARSNADITINATKKGLSIIFRNSIIKNFTDGVEFGICDNRLYLRNSDLGYKAHLSSKNGNPDIHYVYLVHSQVNKALINFIGHYKLQYDKQEKLFYIEKGE